MGFDSRMRSSPHNFVDDVRDNWNLPDSVGIYDTTLRDGAQTPGLVYTREEKLEIARSLDALGVQRIQAGMPAISDEEAAAISEIADLDLDGEIWGFSRCRPDDIDLLVDCGVDAAICEIAMSDRKIDAYGFDGIEDVLERAVETVEYAKGHGLYVAFFPVDMTGASLENLEAISRATVEEGGADELVAVDTVGFALPETMRYLVERLKSWTDVPVQMHCHNDYGLGTACSLAGVQAGAEWIQCSANGLGERTGNADLAEVAVSLRNLYDLDPGIEFEKLTEVSRRIAELAGVPNSPIKPVTGEKTFVRESGAVVSQMYRGMYDAVEPYPPELVGQERDIVLGKKSGQASVRWKLADLGHESVSEDAVAELVDRVKRRSSREKRPVSDGEFAEMAADVLE